MADTSFSSVLSIVVSYLIKLIVLFADTSLTIKYCAQKFLLPVTVGFSWEWCIFWVIPRNIPGTNSFTHADLVKIIFGHLCFPEAFPWVTFDHIAYSPLSFPIPGTGYYSSGRAKYPDILSDFILLQSRKLSLIVSAVSDLRSHPARCYSSSFLHFICFLFLSSCIFSDSFFIRSGSGKMEMMKGKIWQIEAILVQGY